MRRNKVEIKKSREREKERVTRKEEERERDGTRYNKKGTEGKVRWRRGKDSRQVEVETGRFLLSCFLCGNSDQDKE